MSRLRERERGALTIMFAILAVAFFGVISVVAEGARKLENLGQAEDLAAEAARAAAATLDLDAIANGDAIIDRDRARDQAAQIVGTVNGATLVLTFDDSPESAFAVVTITKASFLPGFNIDGIGSHRAAALDPFGP